MLTVHKTKAMIKTLSIKNYAIIEELEIDFSDGLTIITGETGAGKSILLGALNLIRGERADLKVFYNLNEKCVIEATFDVSKYKIQHFFDEQELDYDDEVFVRREISPSGKTRAFVNDTPVNLSVLKKLTNALIDLHQQFDTMDIYEVSFQLRLLDALAKNNKLLEKYQSKFESYETKKAHLDKLIRQSKNADKELEFLNYQFEEFDRIALVAGEQETLEEDLKKLSNAEEIKKVSSAAFIQINDNETSISEQLQELVRQLSTVSKFDSKLNSFTEKLQSLQLELNELGNGFEEVADSTEFEPNRIEETQERLDSIYKLQKKHNVQTIAELIDIQDDIKNQLTSFGDISGEILKLEKELDIIHDDLIKQAENLSKRRKAVVPDFEKKIHQRLGELSMNSAVLKIEFNELQALSSVGIDEVNFLFSANKGGRLQLIKDVASGGEMSRLTLVTKSLVASAIPLPTLIFDEIDSGVSGDVAIRMGDILRKLSREHQVVVITHSPQVASKADAHYFVYKTETDTRTLTKVKRLTEDERVRSIAVMLSQNPPSDAALENAKGLLASAIS